MQSLKDIKRRMGSIGDIHKVTRAMKMVSVAKLRKAEKRLEVAEERNGKLKNILNRKLLALEKIDIPSLCKENNKGKTAYIFISSNKGLCGGFNKNLFKEFRKIDKESKESSYYAIGKKFSKFIERNEIGCERKFIFPDSDYFYKFSRNLISEIIPKLEEGEIGAIKVIFNKNISPITQGIQNDQILPFHSKPESLEETEGELKHICEPSNPELIKSLARETAVSKLFYILELSEVAEHTARMNAMDAASDNALDLLEELELEYNKARQATITTEIIEIASTAEALKE